MPWQQSITLFLLLSFISGSNPATAKVLLHRADKSSAKRRCAGQCQHVWADVMDVNKAAKFSNQPEKQA